MSLFRRIAKEATTDRRHRPLANKKTRKAERRLRKAAKRAAEKAARDEAR